MSRHPEDAAATGAPLVDWLDEPEDHDYPAAASYLSLLAGPEQVSRIVAELRRAPATSAKAKDLLRAGRLDLLTPDNEHVAHDLNKIRRGRPLSPILLVRGDLTRGIPMLIADGYHRVCASYHVDENVDVPARIADLPGRRA